MISRSTCLVGLQRTRSLASVHSDRDDADQRSAGILSWCAQCKRAPKTRQASLNGHQPLGFTTWFRSPCLIGVAGAVDTGPCRPIASRAVPLTVTEWLAAYRRAWIERDPDAAAALFTDDASYRELPYDKSFIGRSGVRNYWASVTSAQDEVELEYGTPIVESDRASVEWWVTMLNGGAEVTLAGSFVLRFDDDGLCRELREYWHVGEGRLEPPAGWGL